MDLRLGVSYLERFNFLSVSDFLCRLLVPLIVSQSLRCQPGGGQGPLRHVFGQWVYYHLADSEGMH
jgi:hypothetical protein